MLPKCKICRWEYRDELEKLYREGKSLSYLVEWCRSKGLRTSRRVLRRHFSHIYLSVSEPTIYEEIYDTLTVQISKLRSELESIDDIPDLRDRIRLRVQLLSRIKELVDLLLLLESKTPIREIEDIKDKIKRIVKVIDSLSPKCREEIMKKLLGESDVRMEGTSVT